MDNQNHFISNIFICIVFIHHEMGLLNKCFAFHSAYLFSAMFVVFKNVTNSVSMIKINQNGMTEMCTVWRRTVFSSSVFRFRCNIFRMAGLIEARNCWAQQLSNSARLNTLANLVSRAHSVPPEVLYKFQSFFSMVLSRVDFLGG